MKGWYIGSAAGLFLLDTLLKESVEKNVECGEERKLFGDKVVLRKVYNKGMLFNVLENYPRVIRMITVFLSVFLLLCNISLLFKKGHYVKKTGMMLLTGGAFSNIYDRLVRGKVIDYIGFKSKNERFSKITFNLADFLIVIGASVTAISGKIGESK